MDFFVYGTLTDADRAAAVCSSVEFLDDAMLDGLHRVDGRYPTLAPGGSVEGRILRTDAVDALDRYEGVDRRLYVRVAVPRTDGGEVQTYVGDPDRLGIDVEWPGDGPFDERVDGYLRDADVTVEPTTES
ncbi:gamma-glutamylcyclotransferase family protein [Haloarculaceae archaeon H-GB2-1]|nr:gamma-glutamylcyclotransferase [Haloarculaceae archaeon H-GB1-1]MEA5385700.1 gamma-glutamylcyclotransferase family protein [Haloarculaceae archaeon H-GB11]MEA5407201.1 gamma-glutamylcyclotransferase family protein [Haloarculaceae archaeon H-GB2-1]